MIKKVELTKRAKKDLKKVPMYIADKLFEWVDAVENEGLEEVRKIKGYHDEPLQGKRLGERSIRLSKSYRAIYVIMEEQIKFCEVREVMHHEY